MRASPRWYFWWCAVLARWRWCGVAARGGIPGGGGVLRGGVVAQCPIKSQVVMARCAVAWWLGGGDGIGCGGDGAPGRYVGSGGGLGLQLLCWPLASELVRDRFGCEIHNFVGLVSVAMLGEGCGGFGAYAELG